MGVAAEPPPGSASSKDSWDDPEPQFSATSPTFGQRYQGKPPRAGTQDEPENGKSYASAGYVRPTVVRKRGQLEHKVRASGAGSPVWSHVTSLPFCCAAVPPLVDGGRACAPAEAWRCASHRRPARTQPARAHVFRAGVPPAPPGVQLQCGQAADSLAAPPAPACRSATALQVQRVQVDARRGASRQVHARMQARRILRLGSG